MEHLFIWLESWNLLSNLGLLYIFVKAPLKPRKVILSWRYINLRMGLVQTLLLIYSMLEFLQCVSMLLLLLTL